MTILEQLQSAFPDVEGIGDARNIAEALAMISGAGGRGANAIADKVSNPGGGVEGTWDWIAENGVSAISSASEVTGTKARYIESYAFAGCNVTSASFPNASYIGNGAFGSCFNLAFVSIPDARSIGTDAFVGTILTSVSFPNASYIGSYAFGGCTLTSASFPNASYIGNNAFQYCRMLTDLYLTGGSMSQVPSLGTDVFVSTPIGGYSASAGQYGSVYVPASLYESFLSAENWSSIASRIVSVSES